MDAGNARTAHPTASKTLQKLSLLLSISFVIAFFPWFSTIPGQLTQEADNGLGMPGRQCRRTVYSHRHL